MRNIWCGVILLLAVAAGCSPKGLETPAPLDSGFPHVQEQGTLVVGAKLCRNPGDCKGVFSVDPTKFGLLPLNLVIENTGDKQYVFSKSYTEIVTLGGGRLRPLYFDQMRDFAQEVSETYSSWFRRRLLPSGDVGRALAADMQRTEILNTMILAGQRYGGFLFFPESEQEGSYQGGVLRVHFKSLTAGEDLTFEFPLL